MDIIVDDLRDETVHQLLQQHLDEMRAVSPPESTHALDLSGLTQPDVTFWTVWQQQRLAGCGALKCLSPHHGEIKSMRTAHDFQQQGVASLLLNHIVAHAQQAGLQQLSLETGSMSFFAPAQRLYQKHGFDYCAPFADYTLDPNSVFMTRQL